MSILKRNFEVNLCRKLCLLHEAGPSISVAAGPGSTFWGQVNWDIIILKIISSKIFNAVFYWRTEPICACLGWNSEGSPADHPSRQQFRNLFNQQPTTLQPFCILQIPTLVSCEEALIYRLLLFKDGFSFFFWIILAESLQICWHGIKLFFGKMI